MNASVDRRMRAYRDDGPVELVRPFGAAVPWGPVFLTVLAVVPVAAAEALARRGGGLLAIGLALGWFGAVAAVAAGRPHDGRLDWAVPALLRIVEYATVIRLMVLVDRSAGAACFAFLAAVVYHHYDIVYRVETRQAELPPWRRLVALGWAGRLAFVFALAAADVMRVGFWIGAAVLGAICLVETATSLRAAGARAPVTEVVGV